MTEQQVLHERPWLDGPLDAGIRHDGLDLRREVDPPTGHDHEIERLYPDAIPRQEQRPVVRVPDREGEHPAQAIDHRGPVARIEVKQHLRIAARCEACALGRKAPWL